MKLSIIVTAYRSKKDLEKYLDRISSLEGKNHEIIFVISTNNDDSLKLIDQYKEKLPIKIKIVYNSRRIGDKVATLQGVSLVEGDYVMFHNLSYQYDSDLVKNLLKEAQTKQSDIIEFKPHFSIPARWKPNMRKIFNKPVKLSEHKEIFAYTYPFTFNKIFKKHLFDKINLIPTLSYSSNAFGIEFVYKALLMAETYSTISITPVKARKYIDVLFNPLKIQREFELMISSDIYKDYVQEIQYNKYFAENMIFRPLVKETKNKVLAKKFIEKMQNYCEKTDFYTLNKYYLLNNPEADKLKNSRKRFATRIYRLLNEKK